jgi:AGCS family alanine or glycine:cation symporter
MLTGMILPFLIISVGALFLIKLKGFFVFHPIKCIRRLACRMKDREARRSLFLALAGTLGVGNIFGVAAGIIIGGAGSLFWIAIATLFSAAIKYAEATLSASHSGEGRGGIHKALARLFPRCGAFLGALYALLAVLLAFLMGSAIQSSALTSCAEASLGIPVGISAAVFLSVVLVSVVGKSEKIASITEKVIPLTTIVYITMSLTVVFINFTRIPHTLSLIVKSAFAPAAVGGGTLSFLFSKGLSEGFARGTLSNEAGTGTSSLAHSRVSTAEPSYAGLAGVLEVFFDTGLLCVLTGLAILTSVDNYSSFTSPMKLVTEAFCSSLGEVGGAFLLLSVFLFAYSTVICWYYYGAECFSFLTGGKSAKAFTVIFLSFIIVGSFVGEIRLLPLTDTVILFMSLLTLSALIISSEEICRRTEEAGLIKCKRHHRA